MITLRQLAWGSYPVLWLLTAFYIVWLTRNIGRYNLKYVIGKVLLVVGLSLNALVTLYNNNSMPVVGMPDGFIPASNIWTRANENSFLFLADHSSLYYFSIGDLILISGGLILVTSWLKDKFSECV